VDEREVETRDELYVAIRQVFGVRGYVVTAAAEDKIEELIAFVVEG
jgi:hypothetical protein